MFGSQQAGAAFQDSLFYICGQMAPTAAGATTSKATVVPAYFIQPQMDANKQETLESPADEL